MKCQPHRVSKRFLSLKERMLIFGWRVEGLSIRDIARQLGRSPSGRVQLSVYPSFCLKGLMHDE